MHRVQLVLFPNRFSCLFHAVSFVKPSSPVLLLATFSKFGCDLLVGWQLQVSSENHKDPFVIHLCSIGVVQHYSSTLPALFQHYSETIGEFT